MMKKKVVLLGLCAAVAFIYISCNKKESVVFEEDNILEIEAIQTEDKTHQWYYFTENGFAEIDLPEHAPEQILKPWTEAIRISSAGSVPVKAQRSDFDAYALVNKNGILSFSDGVPFLYSDSSIYSYESCDGLVFSGNVPVFYLYRSTFFNENSGGENTSIQQSRPFLVEFNPQTKISYPLVSYRNLVLEETDEITGYFWNGTKWACSVKKIDGKAGSASKVDFSYFSWEPLVALTDLSPALNKDVFVFSPCTEAEYRALNTPKLFEQAPRVLKGLLEIIPDSVSFYVSFRDESGSSPISYFQEGNGGATVNAFAAVSQKYMACVFEDGTTYIQNTQDKKITALRLPKLPGGYKYSQVLLSGNTLAASWEETEFYKTGRSGFITVNLNAVLGL